jgi:hypothetical protein
MKYSRTAFKYSTRFGTNRSTNAPATGFLSTTDDLDAAMRRHSGVNLVDERSVVTLARQASRGILSAIDGVVDAVGPGHRAMVLRTYETHLTG